MNKILSEFRNHWHKLEEAASRIAWPDKPPPQKNGTAPKVPELTRLNKFGISLEMLRLAEKTVERAYDSLFWSRIADTSRQNFEENLQYVGKITPKPVFNYKSYSSSINQTKKTHPKKDVYLYPFEDYADLGEIWLVVIGDPVINHFVTNPQAENDFDSLLPQPFKGFKYTDAKRVAELLTETKIPSNQKFELCEKHGLFRCGCSK